MDEARWEWIERTIEYLTSQQTHSEAKFSAWNDQAKQRKEELHQARSSTQVLIEALFALQKGKQETVDRLSERIDRISEKIEKLTESQLHTDGRLNALIGFVDTRLHYPPLTN